MKLSAEVPHCRTVQLLVRACHCHCNSIVSTPYCSSLEDWTHLSGTVLPQHLQPEEWKSTHYFEHKISSSNKLCFKLLISFKVYWAYVRSPKIEECWPALFHFGPPYFKVIFKTTSCFTLEIKFHCMNQSTGGIRLCKHWPSRVGHPPIIIDKLCFYHTPPRHFANWQR